MVQRWICRVVTRGFGYTTALALLLYLAGTMMENPTYIDARHFLIVFCCGMMCSVAQTVFSLRRVPLAIRVLLHYALIGASTLALFLLSGKLQKTLVASGIYLLVFSVAYAAVCAIAVPLSFALRRSRASDTSETEKQNTRYENRFS